MFRRVSKYSNIEKALVEIDNLLEQKKDLTKKIKSIKSELKDANVSKYSLKPRFKELKNEKMINLDKNFNIKLLRAKVEKKDINKIYDDYEKEKKETINSYNEKYLKRLATVETDIDELKKTISNNIHLRKFVIGKYNLSKKYFNIQRRVVSDIKYEAKIKYFEDKFNHEVEVLELKKNKNIHLISDEEYLESFAKLKSEYEIKEKLNLEEVKEISNTFKSNNKMSIKSDNLNRLNIKISESIKKYKNLKSKIISNYKIEMKEQKSKFDLLVAQENISKEKLLEYKLDKKMAVKQIKFSKYSSCKIYKDDIKELKNEKMQYKDSLRSNKEKMIMRFYVDVETFQTRFKSLNAIKLTFLTVFPIILLGAFTTLFSTVIFGTGDGSIVDIFSITLSHEAILWLSRINQFFTVVGAGTNGIIGFYIVIVMSYNVSKNYNQNVIWVSTITSTIAYLLLSNDFLSSLVAWEAAMGTSGMLTAIVLPIVIVKLFSMLDNAESLKFKLPPSIPDAVAKSLNALVPMFILLTSVSFFSIVLRFTTPFLDPLLVYLPGNFIAPGTKTLAQLLSLMIAIPMNLLFEVNLFLGVAIFITLTSVIWWCGINSSAILGAFMWTKFGAGAPDSSFKDSFFGSQLMDTIINIGGAGGTFALLLMVAFLTRRSNWKMVTRIALIPALFGINEPILFGLPIVFNPVLFAPFILAPLAAVCLYVLVQGFGIMDISIDKNVVVPWTAPPIFGAYWATGSWMGAVFAAMVVVMQSIIYAPFVLLDNNIHRMQLDLQPDDKTFSFKKDAMKIIDELTKTGESAKLDEYVNPQEEYVG
ncbi:PTS system, cellobiose-specific IIC component [Spiroplasma sp. TIUS-1]|uniref:PTS sugar transporter subunit IIC n=1 Tax=Spiroplasma sp. TIUS-1 TaxID=216963 RepID=UPI001397BC59|nr:PTS transporter subunit EIIC [Spiroplasma sp. TIUS-1]QHX36057.1 PTS system, cellobiose-specific IIC component [Spiroplasma sp. TIUS-1]